MQERPCRQGADRGKLSVLFKWRKLQKSEVHESLVLYLVLDLVRSLRTYSVLGVSPSSLCLIVLAEYLQDKIYYDIIGDEVAQKFFFIDPRTGVVSLKRTIANEENVRYQVSYRPGRYINPTPSVW